MLLISIYSSPALADGNGNCLPNFLMSRITLPLSAIDVGTRLRQDYKDLPGLMESLKKYGLIQPIVCTPGDETKNPVLIAGGRRYYAHAALAEMGDEQFGYIDVVYKDAADQSVLREMELEENLQRADMTWQEEVLGVLEIHRLKTRLAAERGEVWTQALTSIAIGKSRQRVIQLLPIGRELQLEPKSGIWQCRDTAEAMSFLIDKRENEAKNELARRSLGQGVALQLTPNTVASQSPGNVLIPHQGSLSQALTPLSSGDPSMLISSIYSPPADKVTINLADYFHFGNCLEWMKKNAGRFDHIITDPPYAIDMANLDQTNTGMDVSSTKNEHKVEENLDLLEVFVKAAFSTMKDKGFVVMFCDFLTFPLLVDFGIAAGFAVQRWPLLWCKPSGLNQSAGFNFTKAAEAAVVMRKPGSTLVNHQPLNWKVIGRGPTGEFDHPFAKPAELWNWVIEAVSSPGDTVLEPFAGSGSGVCPLIKSGRQWFACERAEQHVMELLRNVTKTYQEQFVGMKKEVEIIYDPSAGQA